MNALKTTSEWPHHQDKHGNWVPCASNPCKMHGGTEIMAKNPEEAFEKANSAFTEFIKKLNNAGIKLADRTQNDEDIIKELRDNNEYIDDNPRCFHVNDDVSAYDIAHALFPDADYGDNDDTMEALNKRSEAVWHAPSKLTGSTRVPNYAMPAGTNIMVCGCPNANGRASNAELRMTGT